MPTPRQLAFLGLTCLDALYGGAAGGGKAGKCPDRAAPSYNEDMETKVLTPKGFKLIGDVRPGDQVCNPDGTLSRVLAVRDWGRQQFYRVTLSDGSSVEASEGHLWAVSVAGLRKRRKKAPGPVPPGMRPEDEWNLRLMQRCTVVTTAQLRELVARAERDRQAGSRKRFVQLPLTAPVCMTGAKGRWPVLPPYTLGALLGDGHLSERGVVITSADPEIAARIQAELGGGYRLRKFVSEKRPCPYYRVVGRVGQKVDSPQQLLRRDGLLNLRSHQKFIPERAKLSPAGDRRELIRGLFDTDGHIDARGHVEYVTVSERLAKDVQWVLRSLGYKARITTKTARYRHKGEVKEGRLAYRVHVRGADQGALFSLPRKVSRAAMFNGGDVWPAHRVVSVEPTAVENARCITVDHPNSLYVTDDFIVTHNSAALLMAALQFVEVPGYSALLMRRTFADLRLPGALIDRSREWLSGTDARWNAQEHRWRFPAGSTIQFGYCESESDVYRYQGSEYQFVGIDEAGQLTEMQLRYLFSRLRSTHAVPVFTRYRLASNPGGASHEYLKRRYITEPGGRVFVPAKLADNPHLDAGQYAQSLAELDPVTRAQLLEGDWDAVESALFPSASLSRYVECRPESVKSRVRAWDKGYSAHGDYTAGVLMSRTHDGLFVVEDVVRVRCRPDERNKLIKRTAEADDSINPRERVPQVIEQPPGAGSETTAELLRELAGHNARSIRPVGKKEERAEPYSAAALNGLVRLVRAPWNNAFVSEHVLFPEGANDDQVDAAATAFLALTNRLRLNVWL